MSLLDTVAHTFPRLMREAQQLQTSLELQEQIAHPPPTPHPRPPNLISILFEGEYDIQLLSAI